MRRLLKSASQAPPVGKEKIVATVCIFIGGDPGTASGRWRYPRIVHYDDLFEFY